MPETTLAETAAKRRHMKPGSLSVASDPQTLAADLFTAGFFLPKTKDSHPEVRRLSGKVSLLGCHSGGLD